MSPFRSPLNAALTGLASAVISVLPLAAAAADVCFYEHYNYQGLSHCTSATNGDVSATVNDRISSVRVPAGARITLYQHPGFAGKTLQLDANTPNLNNLGFNNLTSSYRVVSVSPPTASDTQIVFVGNSFTHGNIEPTLHYNASNVSDLNGTGYGGVPGIFKQLTVEAGLNYQVAIEAVSGQTLKYHDGNKRPVLGGKRWDVVVMHDYSTLDPAAPGNPTNLIAYSAKLENFFHAEAGTNANPQAKVWLMATWPRPDLIYPNGSLWQGKTLEQIATLLGDGYKAAATQDTAIAGVIPVGDAFVRAVTQGVADRNPYDGIDGDKLNLWAGDSYHASAAGSYLEALVVFGRITGSDPRSLGGNSAAARAMNLTAAQATALQDVAYRQLAASPVH
jgi:hypothetical protein